MLEQQLMHACFFSFFFFSIILSQFGQNFLNDLILYDTEWPKSHTMIIPVYLFKWGLHRFFISVNTNSFARFHPEFQ